jgi:hypothetical protein
LFTFIGISGYIKEIKDVSYNNDSLKADHIVINSYKSSDTLLNITLPSANHPIMYAIYLETLDSTQASPNFRTARRFVLIDNSSAIKIHDEGQIEIVSASPETNYKWQIQNDYVEIDWAEHFYNDWHVHTNLLLPIVPEANQNISGPFEQETGELPVSGTSNFNGIVNYQYKVTIYSNGTDEQTEWVCVYPLKESVRINASIADGVTLHEQVKATDVMNHSVVDVSYANIDASSPSIKDFYIVKGKDKVLVFNNTDLSKMEMRFNAYDHHR